MLPPDPAHGSSLCPWGHPAAHSLIVFPLNGHKTFLIETLAGPTEVLDELTQA